jgi:hypothetical protein
MISGTYQTRCPALAAGNNRAMHTHTRVRALLSQETYTTPGTQGYSMQSRLCWLSPLAHGTITCNSNEGPLSGGRKVQSPQSSQPTCRLVAGLRVIINLTNTPCDSRWSTRPPYRQDWPSGAHVTTDHAAPREAQQQPRAAYTARCRAGSSCSPLSKAV